jgi:Flp pilus assembly protein CpaB
MLLIFGLLAFVVAGLIFIGSQFLPSLTGQSKTASTPTPAVTTMKVIFVAQDIPGGTVITQDSIIEGPWPSTYPLPGLVTDKSTVIGKRARIDLRRGEPVFSSQVVESGAAISDTYSPIALKLQNGRVAIAVPMSRLSGVAYAIGTGDHIMVLATLMFIDLDAGFQTDLPNNMLLVSIDNDNKLVFLEVKGGRIFKEEPLSNLLLATYYVPIENQRARMTSVILVQDARVLNVGNMETKTIIATAQATGQPQTATASIPKANADILIVEVSPEEALAINFVLRLKGDITYAMRSAGDTTVFNIPSLDLKRLMETFKIDLPSKLSYGTSSRVDQPYIPVLGNDVAVEAR